MRAASHAFTLIEMLVVISVIALLVALAVPSMTGAINASRLNQAGEQVAASLSLAQELSNTTSRPVEVRLYKHRDILDNLDDTSSNDGYYRSILVIEYNMAGERNPIDPASPDPLTNPLAIVNEASGALPDGIIMAPDPQMSSMLSDDLPEIPADTTGSATAAAMYARSGSMFKAYETPRDATSYRSILFLPDGVNLDTSKKWFVTVLDSGEATKAPADVKNFFTVQIEPATGRLATHRP